MMVKCYKKDYPRPQLVRDNWINLNGTWDFRFDDNRQGEELKLFAGFSGDRKIQVPFVYAAKMSGIGETERHDCVWYGRNLSLDGRQLESKRFVLHFEGSDFFTKVWVNGQFAGSHKGGYARFSFDITKYVHDGDNALVVKVEDSFDVQQPRGKQRWQKENFGCWYADTTGIWKTVWGEYVPQTCIANIKMTPDMDNDALELEYTMDAGEGVADSGLEVEAEISYKGVTVSRTRTAILSPCQRAKADVFLSEEKELVWGICEWSPDNPCLYDISFILRKDGEVVDQVGSYFAMRDIRIHGSQILLNGRPLYQRLILDQGYWKDSHLTPPSEEALIEDIEKIQALGYNGLRKHQKVEDERFLFWCDVKGMLVWSEMAAAYRYTDYAVQEFVTEWMEIVRQNYNHPCIITWTPFNESWGINKISAKHSQQHFTEAVYHLTKSFDPCRPVIVNDGWEHTVSDIITLHDYEEKGEDLKERYVKEGNKILSGEVSHNGIFNAFAEGYEYKGQPVIISEYGGIAFDNNDEGWGYGNKVKDEEAFLQRFEKITAAVKEIPYVCGYCYTQVTDVQQEVNGLMDAERHYKVDPEKIAEINRRVCGAMTHCLH